jgi:hypothetical protein
MILAAARTDFDVHEAAAFGMDAEVAWLMEDRWGRNNAVAADGVTPLHLATLFRRTKTVQILLDYGADTSLRSRNAAAMTPLHFAALSGSSLIADLLVTDGAEVDAREAAGWTPLLVAVSHGHTDFVRTMLGCGADRTLTTPEGQTPLSLALAKGLHDIARLLQPPAHGGSSARYARRRGFVSDPGDATAELDAPTFGDWAEDMESDDDTEELEVPGPGSNSPSVSPPAPPAPDKVANSVPAVSSAVIDTEDEVPDDGEEPLPAAPDEVIPNEPLRDPPDEALADVVSEPLPEGTDEQLLETTDEPLLQATDSEEPNDGQSDILETSPVPEIELEFDFDTLLQAQEPLELAEPDEEEEGDEGALQAEDPPAPQ